MNFKIANIKKGIKDLTKLSFNSKRNSHVKVGANLDLDQDPSR